MPGNKKTLEHIIFDIIELVFVLLVVFSAVYFLIIGQLLQVDGISMLPGLNNGELLMGEKVSPKIIPLKRGDIVFFRGKEAFGETTSEKPILIKRVVGLPGETIKIAGGRVFINGTLLSEPYLAPETITQAKEEIKENVDYVIGPDSYVLMGDNRGNSRDSRAWGTINKSDIYGRALVVYYPIKEIKIIK